MDIDARLWYQDSSTGSVNSNFVAWGPSQQEPEGQVRKASPIFARRQGKCRRHLRLGRAAWVSRGRAVGTCYSPTSPTKPFLRCQRLRASFLPRAFAAVDRRRGPRDGVLAQVFAKSATRAPIIPQAMDRSRPIRSNRSWPRCAWLHQVTAQFSLRGWPHGSSVASSCS